MANGQSLLDAVKKYLTPAVMQKMSSLAGETPGNTERAMDSIVPTLLSGAAKLADSPGGDSRLMDLISLQTDDGKILNNLNDKLSGGNTTESLMSSGREIVRSLFGGNVGSVVDLIARSVGIKSSTISSLLSVAAPLVLGVLGKERSARGLGTAGLASLLAGQKGLLSQMVPAGLGSLIGSNDIGKTKERIAETARYETPRAAYDPSRERRSQMWIWPVLALAALGLLLYSFWPRRAIEPEETIAKQETRPETQVQKESIPAVAPAPIQREATPLTEPPRVAKEDVTGIKSGTDTLAGDQNRPIPAVRSVQGLSGPQDVRRVQEALRNQGQDPGPIDGIMGPRTRRALIQFQKANGLQQTGTLDEETRERLVYDR
jgi:hypothetical protein